MDINRREILIRPKNPFQENDTRILHYLLQVIFHEEKMDVRYMLDTPLPFSYPLVMGE
jgi:hypothetical protein